MKSQLKINLSILAILIASSGCGSEETQTEPAQKLTTNGQTAFQALNQLTVAERDSLLTENGFLNNKGKTIFVYGRVQLSGTTTCKTADLQLKMSDQSPWIRVHHFFVEGNPARPGVGAGISFGTQFFLPIGARAKIKADTNSNCNTGSVFLGGDVLSDGTVEQNIYDWSFTSAE